ncbi:MAG: pseudouridylate synthase [Osedax symbiont Rs2]|nr:MAG: pseudouridylate synthase [Osedax symbiont Rs2]
MNRYPTDYQYLYGKPECSAVIRTSNEDFLVTEIPAFEPDGEGEHWYIKIRKNGENSDWVAKQLAQFFKVTSKEIGYAGKKDRHAITEQWFSVCLPGVKTISMQAFSSDSIEVLEVQKHSRKLRTGALKGNKFSLYLREVSDDIEFARRLAMIEKGVPNYFGEQRFGIGGGNLSRGISLLKEEFKERNRNKKGLYISAVRSWFFNHLLSARIKQQLWSKIMTGDVMMLEGSKSHFVADDIDALTLRMNDLDLHLTGPMCGRGRQLVTQSAQQWENALLCEHLEIIERLEYTGLSQDRRSIRLLPGNLQSVCVQPGIWQISFELPPGSFATSVLRELCDYRDAGSRS